MDSSSWAEYSKIDPQFEAILPHLPGSDLPEEDIDMSAHRAQVNQKIAEALKSGWSKTDLADVAIKEVGIPFRDGVTIKAFIYRSETAEPGPLFVYFHGGGFMLGSPDIWLHTGAMVVKEFGAVVLSVGYRLAPENPFPTAANDSWDALKWAAENATALGADPTKGFIVAGTSAGGNLAAVAAHEAVDAKLSPPLTGVYLSVPVLTHPESIPEEYRQHHRSVEQNKDAAVLNELSLIRMWKTYKADPKSHLASPLWWPGGHKTQPPTYIQVCGLDPLRDDSLIYEHLLKESGVPVKMDVYAGIPHGAPDMMPTLSKSKQAAADLQAGLKWLLDQKA